MGLIGDLKKDLFGESIVLKKKETFFISDEQLVKALGLKGKLKTLTIVKNGIEVEVEK